MKSIYRHLFLVAFLMAIAFGINIFLKDSLQNVYWYIAHIFLPFQRAKSSLFNLIPFSLGDYIYLAISFLLISSIIRVIYYALHFSINKIEFFIGLMNLFAFALGIYLFFLISWGGNYYRPKLSEQWGNKAEAAWNEQALIQLNQFLVKKLNDFDSEKIDFPDLKLLNKEAGSFYLRDFGKGIPKLKVKETTLGYLLSYLGVNGYYNPISGEAQFNKDLPAFMHPFIITHEMAHQSGIAAEDDANLVAYWIGIRSGDPAFRYSAYFNIFLYSYFNLRMKDSSEAKVIWQSLGKTPKEDFKDLRQLYRKYRGFARNVSNDFYDSYLRWNGQQKGLDSYDVVIKWVYYWEFETKERADLKIYPFP